MTRPQNLQKLHSETFDILVIGAGASGAGSALDAALRGHKVALMDKGDFASETSSKSTKLIHGGVRYLEQAFKNFDFAQLRQVKHGLAERHILLQNAPHLARPLALITPVRSWFEAMYFNIGLKLYGWFAKHDSLPSSSWLSRAETFAAIPNLHPRMHSAVQYYDGQLDDARYGLALVQTAAANGVIAANYIQVIDFEIIKYYDFDKKENYQVVNVKDTLTGNVFSIRAKVILNCTGTQADTIRKMANPNALPRIRTSKGVHIVLPKSLLSNEAAMLIPKTPDGRLVFVIPFQNHTVIGTTDDEYFDTNQEPHVLKTEVDYLLNTLAPYVRDCPQASDVRAGFAGLRPLILSRSKSSTKQLLRDHEVEVDETSGLVSLLGGKWTTYRLMAKDAVDVIEKILLGKTSDCLTESRTLVGSEQYDFDLFQNLIKKYSINPESTLHLERNYGSKAMDILKIIEQNPSLATLIINDYPYLKAEVIYATRYEMCCTIRDFLARRIRLEILDWNKTLLAIPVVTELMANELGWSESEIQAQIDIYKKQIKDFCKNLGIN